MSHTKNPNYCGAVKRIFAFLIDFICIIIIAVNLNNFVFNPLLKDVLKTNQYEEEYKTRLVESELYFLGEDNLCYSLDLYDDLNTSISKQDFILYLENGLNKFYNNESFTCADVSYYNKLKEEAVDVFLYDEATKTFNYKSDVTDDKKIEFLTNAVDYSINKVLVNDSKVMELTSNIMLNGLYSLLISTILSLLVFYLTIPLISKKNYTIGKYMFKIGTINSVTNRNAKKSQIAVRYLVLIAEFILSLFTFGAILLISFAFTIFTKKSSSFHDLAAKTKLVDLTTFKLYNENDVIDEGELACQ